MDYQASDSVQNGIVRALWWALVFH